MAYQAFVVQVQYRMERRLLLALKKKAQQELQKLHMYFFVCVNKLLL